MTAPAQQGRLLTRVLAAVGATAGAVLLVRPRRLLDAVAPEFPPSRTWLARALGARLLIQHATVLLAPEAPVVRIASAVDLVHAASVVPFLRSARYGRAARISGGVAAACAALAPVLAPAERP